MGISREQYEAMQARTEAMAGVLAIKPSKKAVADMKPRDRGMNRTEAAYARYLNGFKATYRYEPIKFRLADNTTYTPDFMVIDDDGAISFVDTKAFWKSANKVGITEDAAVKIKVVAELYPWFTFQIAWLQDGIWVHKGY